MNISDRFDEYFGWGTDCCIDTIGCQDILPNDVFFENEPHCNLLSKNGGYRLLMTMLKINSHNQLLDLSGCIDSVAL